ncbi:MAG: hypothetical protein L0I04_12275, partial [Acidipropionibacterium jensenii]
MIRVAVIGGTGTTGRLVLEGLTAMRGATPLCAARHPDHRPAGARLPRHDDPGSRPGVPGVEYRRLDVLGDRRSALAALEGIDWAVVCLGPFEHLRARAQELCIEAGVHYLDVNDSIDARRDTVALDGPARAAGVRVITGCGLCPGISTMLLGALAGRADWPVESVTSDLIVGAGQPVGAASLTSMLLSLTGEVRARRAGTVVRVPATVDRSVRVGGIRTRYLVGYECPDIDVVQRIVPGVSEYSYRVCFEQLPGFAVDLVHRLS